MSTDEEDDGVLPRETEEIQTKRDKYKTVRLLGEGGYGAVFEVIRKSDGKHLAIKCEKMSARKKVLAMDCKVLRGAREIKSRHFCTIEDRGKVENRFCFMVMKLIGSNLWDLRMDREPPKYTLGTSLKMAAQCLVAIEELHRIGFLHRDIKPGNFAVGQPEANEQQTVYLLDFGLCRKFMVAKDKDVRIPRDIAPFRGTTRYAPLAAMKEIDQSRKDDIESWLYMVVEWTGGGLPWRKYNAENRIEVLKMKEELRTSEVALARMFEGCPKREFTRILKYLDELNYFSIPDYKFVLSCVEHAMKHNGIKQSDPLDWDPLHSYVTPVEEPGNGKPMKDVEEREEDFDAPGTVHTRTRPSVSRKNPKK